MRNTCTFILSSFICHLLFQKKETCKYVNTLFNSRLVVNRMNIFCTRNRSTYCFSNTALCERNIREIVILASEVF
jgi:hypothetical protein